MTPGKYYRCPVDTPFVAGDHVYGSATWLDRNWDLMQTVGEDLETPRKWYNGSPPAVLPNAEQIGSAECLQRGENSADILPPDQIRDGFNIACYVPAVPLDPLWEMASSYNSCSLQFFYATVIQWIYQGEDAKVQAAFTLLLGPSAVTTVHPSSGNFPGMATVITPAFSIAVCGGTNNYQQLALQGFYTLTGPVNISGFSCNAIHYLASQWVNNWLTNDGANPAQPVMLVGHSYGGAAVAILAARFTTWRPERTIRILTYGDPKPGDVRLQELLRRCPGIALQNFQDLVCSLPPDYLTVAAVSVALALPGLLAMRTWEYEPGRTMMDEDGNLFPNQSPVIGYSTMLAYVGRALLNLPIAVIVDHEITIYRQRILFRCPEREWPISIPLWNLLQGLDLGEYWADDYFGLDFFGEDFFY